MGLEKNIKILIRIQLPMEEKKLQVIVKKIKADVKKLEILMSILLQDGAHGP